MHTIGMLPSNNLKLCTFNCKGHNLDRIEYMRTLIKECDLLLVQEHWYLECNINKLESEIGNVNVIGTSGMDEQKLIRGRPYGGCAIVYRKDFKCTVIPVKSGCKRLCACILELHNKCRILVVNKYMPCDNENEISAYRDMLTEVSNIISDHNDIDHEVVGGDFNTDIS